MNTPDAVYTSFPLSRVAELIAVSPDIVRDHVEAGRLRAYDAGTGTAKRCWRVRAIDLAAFIADRANIPEPTPAEPPRRRTRTREAPTTPVTEFY